MRFVVDTKHYCECVQLKYTSQQINQKLNVVIVLFGEPSSDVNPISVTRFPDSLSKSVHDTCQHQH